MRPTLDIVDKQESYLAFRVRAVNSVRTSHHMKLILPLILLYYLPLCARVCMQQLHKHSANPALFDIGHAYQQSTVQSKEKRRSRTSCQDLEIDFRRPCIISHVKFWMQWDLQYRLGKDIIAFFLDIRNKVILTGYHLDEAVDIVRSTY
jgi:hypothetical protein